MTHAPKALPLVICLAAGPALADDEAPDDMEDTAVVVECMAAQGLPAQSVVPARLPGLFEVEVQGGDYLYVTPDCRYLIFGNLYEIQDDQRLVGVTEERRSARRRKIVEDIPSADMLVFSPDERTLASVVVFTDTDCGYCRQMHNQMADYNAHGIEIRYVAYPRAGIPSETYDRMVSAWCADDPLDAITKLKNGQGIPRKVCVNPVATQYEIGRQIGFSGTPTIVLADGRVLPGYSPPEQLAGLLDL